MRRQETRIFTDWQSELVQQTIDELKRDICKKIYRKAVRERWNRTEAAFWLKTSPSCVSLVYNEHIDKLTLSQLFMYLGRAEPYFRVLIAT